MNKCIFLLASILLAFQMSRAQNNNAGQQLIYLINPVHISIDNNGPVENFLVVISDSTGQTIFLDNRYHLVGPYTRNVDLSKSGKGPYSLCIAKDGQRSLSRFYIK